jgi:hypothetical protein
VTTVHFRGNGNLEIFSAFGPNFDNLPLGVSVTTLGDWKILTHRVVATDVKWESSITITNCDFCGPTISSVEPDGETVLVTPSGLEVKIPKISSDLETKVITLEQRPELSSTVSSLSNRVTAVEQRSTSDLSNVPKVERVFETGTLIRRLGTVLASTGTGSSIVNEGIVSSFPRATGYLSWALSNELTISDTFQGPVLLRLGQPLTRSATVTITLNGVIITITGANGSWTSSHDLVKILISGNWVVFEIILPQSATGNSLSITAPTGQGLRPCLYTVPSPIPTGLKLSTADWSHIVT